MKRENEWEDAMLDIIASVWILFVCICPWILCYILFVD